MKAKTCSICGNDIPERSTRCRYCSSSQPLGARSPVRRKYIYTVNLEVGFPSVVEGLTKLETELLRAEHSGVHLIRVIHGWGSGGVGGKLKEACRVFLRQKVAARQIKSYLPGEDYSRESPAGRRLINRYPKLRGSERSDRYNQGITFVEL
ncbi:MAG TPA: hypothetical protein GX693_02060 [Firmicutes bacterium]|nr:hypothetical protein [Bacillota bacterium]